MSWTHTPDWPPNVKLTGFFAWDTPCSYSPPDGLGEFFDAGPAPILITLGGSSAVDPQLFYPNAVAAARRLGHRALVAHRPHPGTDPPRPLPGHIRGSVRPAHSDRTEMPCRDPPWRHRNNGWGPRGGAATAHRATQLRSTADRATHEPPWRCDNHSVDSGVCSRARARTCPPADHRGLPPPGVSARCWPAAGARTCQRRRRDRASPHLTPPSTRNRALHARGRGRVSRRLGSGDQPGRP